MATIVTECGPLAFDRGGNDKYGKKGKVQLVEDSNTDTMLPLSTKAEVALQSDPWPWVAKHATGTAQISTISKHFAGLRGRNSIGERSKKMMSIQKRSCR
jgi:hypothetical protein